VASISLSEYFADRQPVEAEFVWPLRRRFAERPFSIRSAVVVLLTVRPRTGRRLAAMLHLERFAISRQVDREPYAARDISLASCLLNSSINDTYVALPSFITLEAANNRKLVL